MSKQKQQITFIELLISNVHTRIDTMMKANSLVNPNRSKKQPRFVENTAIVKFKTLDRTLITELAMSISESIKSTMEDRELTVRSLEDVDISVLGNEYDFSGDDGGISFMLQWKITTYNE